MEIPINTGERALIAILLQYLLSTCGELSHISHPLGLLLLACPQSPLTENETWGIENTRKGHQEVP